MRSVSVTDLRRRSGEVFVAADQEPVAITRRGTKEFVLLSQTQFDEFLALQKGRGSETRNAPEPQLTLLQAAMAKAQNRVREFPDHE